MINLKNVSYAYHKKRPVLSTINLEIKAGHIYGLLGENGAGKSTLLKMIGGMVFPQTGEVDVMGHCPAERTPEFLSQLFFIPEEFTLPPVKMINKERIALNASMDEIGRCLSFKVLKETNEKVIYGEQSLSGIQAILPNTEQEDTRIDIELFFKGMLLKETELLELLTPTTIHHEQHV